VITGLLSAPRYGAPASGTGVDFGPYSRPRTKVGKDAPGSTPRADMRLLVKVAGARARGRPPLGRPRNTHRRLSQTPETHWPPGPLPGACPWGWKPKEGCGLCVPGTRWRHGPLALAGLTYCAQYWTSLRERSSGPGPSRHPKGTPRGGPEPILGFLCLV